MPLSVARVRHCLQTFDFATLFLQELGWNRHSANLTVATDGKTFALHAIAEKQGMQVFECPAEGDAFPDYPFRRRIERQVGKSAHEHLIIYTDAGKTLQTWQWLKREQGRPLACREHTIHKTQPGDALIQKLQHLAFALEEEENLSLVHVTQRARRAFDVDRITKRFYDRFKTEHTAFWKFIQGITDMGDREWYASLMLNRLMFVYFIQKKGFLDGDNQYLRNRLQMVREGKGKDRFLSFYRYFLLRLFHEGLGQPPDLRKKDLEGLIGDVPYLNAGLFDVHDLEAANPDIQILDEAFEKVFDFFDAYQWHLDERPLRADNEINPDVLGYIFEKYINQKQMGAYYTKEDITGYIARNTVVPFLFNAAEKKCSIAFKPESAVWRLLRDDPDRYIYPAVRHGVDMPLPPAVAAGATDVSRRGGWNGPTTPEFGLPTETWREYMARRQRCQDLRATLKAGEIRSINDLVTYNLDIGQFAEDVIESCEGPELLRAFYRSIAGHIPEKSNEKHELGMSVLDPACGSGAFLFAALNILEPLYEACLDRMEAFLEDLERSRTPHHPAKFSDFRKIRDEVAQHPYRRYFILKSIIINNLYGVDIMEEAVEICKLRLFLKLVAQVEKVKHLEPLPDIDFNIRAGNSLVGFASLDEVTKTLEGNLGFGRQEVNRIVEDADVVGRAFKEFRALQIEHGMDARQFAQAKGDLRQQLDRLRSELDRYLASEYGVSAEQPKDFQAWHDSHLPFHWFAEFYGIMHHGGFDVIIGNPPYVEIANIADQYALRQLALVRTGNLFAVCAERFSQLLPAKSQMGIIVPISSVSTPRMLPLMELLASDFSSLYLSHFAVRPGKLFVGVDMNLTIVIARKGGQEGRPELFSTRYNRWYGDYRPFLFATLSYSNTVLEVALSSIPKLGSAIEAGILTRALEFQPLARLETAGGHSERIYYHSGGRYYRKCLRQQLSNEYKALTVSAGWGDILIALLSSSFYYWLWIGISDCYHVTRRDIESIPVPQSLAGNGALMALAQDLQRDLWQKAEHRIRNRADGSQQQEVNFNVGAAKPTIDKIDKLLAEHFEFSEEQIDFIVSYDAKYRET